VLTTARAQVGAVTSAGRMLRLGVVDVPALPPTAGPLSLSGGAPVSEFLDLGPGERVLALVSLSPDSPGVALGTAAGVVKRVLPDAPARDAWEVVSLRDGDEVVGAVELRSPDDELVFVSSDAQLLHFGAAAVRPQGRSAGGMAGIRLAPGARAVFFGALPSDVLRADASPSDVPADAACVVTVAGSSSALPGTQAGTGKVTPLTEYPAKGRATAGVRCHRFLRGEDALLLAWVGPPPPRAVTSAGSAVDLPPGVGRRDGSGTALAQPVHAVGGPVA
jgi:DNA gyrase subunit A